VNGLDNPLDEMVGGYCWGLIHQVLQATGYDPNESGYDPVPSNGKRLGNQVPHTSYGPTYPG
jgi:hypothetical protein